MVSWVTAPSARLSGDDGRNAPRSRPARRAYSSHPIPRQVSHTTPIGVSTRGHQESARRRWRSRTWTERKPLASRVRIPGAGAAGAISQPGDWHQIPDHAGRAPAVAVAHADHEAAGAPGERDHRVAAGPGELVGLGAGVHDLEAVEPRGDQASRAGPSGCARTPGARRPRGRRTRSRSSASRREQAGPVPAVRAAIDRQRVAQEHDVGPPGAHLDAGAAAAGPSAAIGGRDRVVVGDEHGIESGAAVPARDWPRRRSRDISVPRTSCETLVWLWKSTAARSGPAPASASIGRCHRSPPARKRRSPGGSRRARPAPSSHRGGRCGSARSRSETPEPGTRGPGRAGTRAAGSCSASRRRPRA